MKKWEQRRNLLMDELSARGRLSVGQIQDLLQVSESTARRMIIEMEQDHLVIRTFGGIQKIEASSPHYSYQLSRDEHASEKEKIGQAASLLIENNDTVFLSGGSTVKYMALALKQRILQRELHNVSIVTNSLVSAQVLSDCTDVIMPGGIYREELQVLDGSLTERNLRGMCFSKAFFGVVAIDESEGYMTADIATNSINELVLSRAASFYVLADSSKFNRHSFISYAPLSAAAAVITDQQLDASVKDAYLSHGATIRIAAEWQNDMI